MSLLKTKIDELISWEKDLRSNSPAAQAEHTLFFLSAYLNYHELKAGNDLESTIVSLVNQAFQDNVYLHESKLLRDRVRDWLVDFLHENSEYKSRGLAIFLPI